MNSHLKKLANEGKKAAKVKGSNKKHCKECKKDVKNLKTIQCFTCKEITHYNCLSNSISDARKDILSQKNEFKCGPCRVYPDQVKEAEDDEITTIDDIKMTLLLPDNPSPPNALIDLTNETESRTEKEPSYFNCTKCDFTHTEKSKLDEHIKLTHEHKCSSCEINFGDKLDFEKHNN